MNSKTTETTTQRTNRLLAMSRAELVLHAQDLTLRIEELEGAVRLQKEKAAQAVTACNLKDESLEAAHNGLRWWMDAFPLHVTEADNEEMLKIVKALAIQPDDAALKAWLGEPVAWMQISVEEGVDTQFPRKEKPVKYNKDWWEFEPLYSPKGLK